METGRQRMAALLGEEFAPNNPVRQAVELYTHSTGIEGGYGFFAPNVPDNYKLVFELRFPDGRVELVLPAVGSESSGVRMVDLLDRLAQVEYPALRELMVRMLATATWRRYPEAEQIRAVFGAVALPTREGFRRGEKEQYEPLFVYDFRFIPSPPER